MLKLSDFSTGINESYEYPGTGISCIVSPIPYPAVIGILAGFHFDMLYEFHKHSNYNKL